MMHAALATMYHAGVLPTAAYSGGDQPNILVIVADQCAHAAWQLRAPRGARHPPS